jgi:hypothetical protein
MASSNKQINKTYSSLIKLSKKEMQFVEDDWHHACLSYYTLYPTDDEMYNSFDLDIKEIELIINKYGKTPSRCHWYWDEIKNTLPDTNNNIET